MNGGELYLIGTASVAVCTWAYAYCLVRNLDGMLFPILALAWPIFVSVMVALLLAETMGWLEATTDEREEP